MTALTEKGNKIKPGIGTARKKKGSSRLKRIDAIIDNYKADKKALLSILLDLQAEFNHLSKTAMVRVSRRMQIPLDELYMRATKYKEFRFTPLKKHRIKVCRCSVCYVKGADKVLDSLKTILGIKPGETTEDGEYSLEIVNDLSLSPCGPVIMVDDNVYTKVTPKKAKELFLKKELIWIVKPYEEMTVGKIKKPSDQLTPLIITETHEEAQKAAVT